MTSADDSGAASAGTSQPSADGWIAPPPRVVVPAAPASSANPSSANPSSTNPATAPTPIPAAGADLTTGAEPPVGSTPTGPGATPARLWATARNDLRTARQNVNVRDLAGKQSYQRRGSLLLALVVAATGLFGGLNAKANGGTPTATVGQAIAGQPWDVTVDSSRVVPADSLGSLRPEEGRHWLAVVATVEVTADAPRPLGGLGESDPGLLTIAGAAGINSSRPDQIALLRDGSIGPVLQPGVPEKVAFLWEQLDSAPAPASLTVTVYNLSHVRDSNGELTWLYSEPKAEVVIEVKIGVATPTPTSTSTGSASATSNGTKTSGGAGG